MATAAQLVDIDQRLTRYAKALKRLARDRDFAGAARVTFDFLQEVAGLESEWNVHFAMTRHVLESVGLIALHGIDYAARSGGDTCGLTKSMLALHRCCLRSCLRLDRAAQPLHARGVGILVNDLPAIPFEAGWQAYERRRYEPAPIRHAT